MFPGTETVTVVRGPGRDNFGDTVAGASTEFAVDECLLAPLASAENTDNAETVTSGWTLYRLGTADIRPTDMIRARGDLHQVVGRIRDWDGVGIEVTLSRVTG